MNRGTTLIAKLEPMDLFSFSGYFGVTFVFLTYDSEKRIMDFQPKRTNLVFSTTIQPEQTVFVWRYAWL